MVAYDMVIQTLSCKCGGERIRGDSCGDCGFKPKPNDAMEINTDVVRRRELVRKVEELVEGQLKQEADAPGYWDIVLPIADEEYEWFNRVLTPLLVSDPMLEGAEPIADFVVQVDRARQALRPMADLRPHADMRAQLEVLDRIAGWWPIYRTAATTVDRALIEAKKNEGQRAIDTSLQADVELRPVLDALEVLDDYESEPSLTKRQVHALTIKYPEQSLQQISYLGAEELAELVGEKVHPELGLHHLMLEVLAHGALSPEQFRTKLSEAAALWRGKEERAREIADMTHSVDQLANVSVEFAELFVAFDRAVKGAKSPGGIVRAAKRLFNPLYEEAQPLWVWARLLADESLTSEAAYADAAQQYSTFNVGQVKDVLPTVCADAEKFYRNATHHGSAVVFDEASNEVAVSTIVDGTRKLNIAEFIDRVYALVESVLALYWMAQVFLTQYQIELPIAPDMPSGFGVSTEDEAFWYFEVRHGVAVYRNEVVNEIWHMEAEFPPHAMFTAAVMMSLRADPKVKEVRLSRPGCQNQLMYVHPEHVKERMEASMPGGQQSGEEPVFWLLKYKAASTLEGMSMLTEEDLRYAAVVYGYQLLSDSDSTSTRIRQLRTVMRWAKEQQHDEIESLCRGTINAWRQAGEAKKYFAMRKLQDHRQKLIEPEVPRPAGIRLQVPQQKEGTRRSLGLTLSVGDVDPPPTNIGGGIRGG